MSLGSLRGMQSKGFTATILVPASTPDGTSLEEKINTWIADEGSNFNLIDIEYQVEGANYTALLIYSK